jgi:signal peptidase II
MNEPVGWTRWLLFWTIALGGAAFDLGTKSLVFSRIGPPPARPVPIFGDILEFHTNYNPGALWGLGRDLPHSSLIFAALSVVAALAICYYLFVRRAATDIRMTIALGLIMAGAIGNCSDRLWFGHVRDFVHFHVDSIGFDFAIFNFADNMLVLGAVAIMLIALRPENGEPERRGDGEGALAHAEAGAEIPSDLSPKAVAAAHDDHTS